MRWLALSVLGFAVEVAAQPAPAAQPASVCEQAYEQAQVRRQKRQLLAARELLMQCAQAECPQVARADCATWLMEVERSIPSVILLPRRGGVDLVDIMAVIDGTPTMVKPGAPLPLEPGPHRIVVQAGTEEQTTSFTLPEGEKLRQIVFEFGPEPVRETSQGLDTSEPLFGFAVATGAGALVSFGLFTAFGALGLSEEDALGACKPSCAPDEVSSVEDLYIAADISLTAGAVLGVASATLFAVWAVSPSGAREEEALMLRPSVALGPDRAWVGVEGVLP